MRTISNILLIVTLFCIQPCLEAQNWDQVLKTTSNPRQNSDYYGFKVSISGDYAVVGAPYHDYDPYNINFLNGAGAVFILKKDAAGNWAEHQKIVAPDRVAWDLFGYEVRIQDDAIIIGAIGNDRDANNNFLSWSIGAVYIFRKLSDGKFYHEQKLVPADTKGSYHFGISADIDGKYAIIGKNWDDYDNQNIDYMNDAGSAYIYERNNKGKWVLHKKITPSDRDSFDYFGRSVSISGNHAVIGSFGSKYPISKTNSKWRAGAAYIFTNFNGVWGENQKLTAPTRRFNDIFGFNVSMDDSMVLIGAYGDDYDAYENNWIGNAGATHLFTLNGFVWKHSQKIVAIDRTRNSHFGYSVNVNENTLAVGAFFHQNDLNFQNPFRGAGAGYIFKKEVNNQYAQSSKLVAKSRDTLDYFGRSIATTDDFAIVGAHLEDDDKNNQNKRINTGSAYIFKSCNSKSEISVNACSIYHSPSGNFTWTQSGTYQDIIKNYRGCDSMITITLKISQPDTQRINAVACGSYISPSGKYSWTQTGQYIDYVQSPGVCDSVKLIDLIVKKHTYKSMSVSHCGAYASPSGKYVWNSDGVYQDIIPNFEGCDSVLTIILKITEPTYATHHVNACQKFVAFSGSTTWNSSGIYHDTVTNNAGCDSIITVILTLNHPDTGVINFGNQLIAKANDGLYQWLDCNLNFAQVDGAEGQSFYAKTNGSYALDVADNGCRDTTSCYRLYRVSAAHIKQSQLSIYPNPSDGIFKIKNPKGSSIQAEIYNAVGIKIKNVSLPKLSTSELNLSDQADGMYFLQLVDKQGNKVHFSLIKI